MHSAFRAFERSALVTLVLSLFLGVALPIVRGANALPPDRMTYQGFLVDPAGGVLGVGGKNYDMVFAIYDDPIGGSLQWSEDQTVTVNEGYFSVVLGEGRNTTGSLAEIFSSVSASDRHIEFTVKSLNGGDVTIKPRLRLLSSPYAFLARHANTASKIVESGGMDVVTTAGARVGINNAAPASELDVNGTVTATQVNAGTVNGFGTIPIGGIIMWSGATVPNGWALCDGQTGTPDLRARFVVGMGPGYTLNATGGNATYMLNVSQVPLPAHRHFYNDRFDSDTSPSEMLSDGSTSTRIPWAGSGDEEEAGDGVARDSLKRETELSAAKPATQSVDNRPPYYALAFIMRVQ